MIGEPLEYLSYGAGPPSLALAILNARGEIIPRAQLIVFADTGGEKTLTYSLLEEQFTWLGEHDMEVQTVKSSNGTLEQYVRERSLALPIHTLDGLGKRQCTDGWKIEPIERYLHLRFGKARPLIAQLALSYDVSDMIRMRDPRVKRNKNRWPLVEKKVTRAMAVEIIRAEGLTVPPWSACYFCPLQSDGRWRWQAANTPDDFRRAVVLDDFLRQRSLAKKHTPVWLSGKHRPLSSLYSTLQSRMLWDESPDDSALCDSGRCMT